MCVCVLTPVSFVRHEERTWSLEHSDSILSDSPGMMSSSVGTSKCSSPACMEARARRAAHCGYSDSHRPGLQYGDSFDSLGDSPHSDRWGPLRLRWRRARQDHFWEGWSSHSLSQGTLDLHCRSSRQIPKCCFYQISLTVCQHPLLKVTHIWCQNLHLLEATGMCKHNLAIDHKRKHAGTEHRNLTTFWKARTKSDLKL